MYHEAARLSRQVEQDGSTGANACLDRLASIEDGSVEGFEKQAIERLRRSCEQWKQGER